MKIVAIGDIHGRSIWKQIVAKEKDADVVVFIGDYFDTREDIIPLEQMNNFKEIIEYKETSFANEGKEDQCKTKVYMLIGNHDYPYFPEIGYNGTSGYQHKAAVAISHLLNDNRNHLQMCLQVGKFLFSHAGIGKVWLEDNGWRKGTNIEEFVNDMWKYKPLTFQFSGFEPHGDSTTQTPIWIRPASLIRTWKKVKDKPVQIVGHTAMKRIDLKGTAKYTGGKFYFIDTLGTSQEYLIIKDDVISVGKIEKQII